jgi:hypothetical protein
LNSDFFFVYTVAYECVQVLSFGNGFALSIAFTDLPNDSGEITLKTQNNFV